MAAYCSKVRPEKTLGSGGASGALNGFDASSTAILSTVSAAKGTGWASGSAATGVESDGASEAASAPPTASCKNSRRCLSVIVFVIRSPELGRAWTTRHDVAPSQNEKEARKENNAPQPSTFRSRPFGCISFFAAPRDAFCRHRKIASMQAALGLETGLARGDSGAPSELKGFGTAELPFANTRRRRTDVPMSANARRCLTIVLAAGEGVRMRSARPKVLHELAGRSMLAHVLSTVREGTTGDMAVVVGSNSDGVAAEALRAAPEAKIAIQHERRGTADAVLAARDQIERGYDDILVLYADTPLIEASTLAAMRAALASGADVVALGFEAADPTGYGRLIERNGRLIAIREHKDASAEERASCLCNAGPIAFSGAEAVSLLTAVKPTNAQNEYYLTDIVEIASARGLTAKALLAQENEVMGVNDRAQLAAAEAALQDSLRRRAMAAGATLTAPETVFLSFDARIGRDVLIEPHVVIGLGCNIEDGAVIRAFSHLEGARVAGGAIIGPFARLRSGADIAINARIGNFVEIKQSSIEEGAKVNHLTYIGDARVGAKANIGAGTITCNYDGFAKHRTDIGAGAFIGSNSALVAPVTIGDGAYVGSGSVITKPVEADALAVARGRQEARGGWAKAFRARHKKK